MRRLNQTRLPLVLVLCLFLAGCGETALQALRATIAIGGPFIDDRVAVGKLTSTQGEALKTDLDDGVGCADTLQKDFTAIAKTDPEVRIKKLNAGVRAGRCWKTILLRQNFAIHPDVQRIANLIDGAFAAVIVFYSTPGEMKASVQESAASMRDEKELEKDLEKRIKELREALKAKP